jgi:predicted AlkP superfamily phosphohydrolase/phosphomutase
MTGKNPDKHGIFDFTRFEAATCTWKINNSQHVRSKTIWQLLSEKGKRVAVLGLPYTYPTYEINGAMVAGWDAPTLSAFTYPENLAEEVFKLIPDYGSALDLTLWNYLPAESDADFAAFLAKLVTSFEQSAKLASHFLKKEPWDVFMVHFQQTDWAQHKVWGYIERACHDSEDKSRRLEQVRECYSTFDRLVGKLLEEVTPSYPLRIILSDHGFGSNRGTIYPNYVLQKRGYYHLKQEIEGGLKKSIKHSRFGVVRDLYRTLASTRAAFRGRQAMKKYKSWADMANETIPQGKVMVDWNKTKAAFVGGSEVGFVFINVKGRGRFGCVEPGAEYEDIVAKLIADFENLTDPKTGKRLMARVARGSDIYADPSEGVLVPDIVLIPIEGFVVGVGLAEPFIPEGGERGDHRHNGILVMQGANLQRRPTVKPQLTDIAPTILHAMGLPVPSDMDGRVLEEVFRNPAPVRFEDIDNSCAAGTRDYADQETDLIEQRLRALGYVE